MNDVLKPEELLDALDSLVWYNGAGETLEDVKRYLQKHTQEKTIPYPYNLLNVRICNEEPRIIWFLMVCMFGEYGTSPRSGWIEGKNRDKAIAFIDAVMRTHRESEGE